MKWGKGAKAQRGVAKLCRTLHNKAAKEPTPLLREGKHEQ